MRDLVRIDEALDVLVVEDSEDYAELVAQWLRDNPLFAVETRFARTAAEALEELDKPTDVVLLDLGLPDSDDLGTVRKVLDASDAAVVALTGRKDDGLALAAIRLGVQEYLVKHVSNADAVVRAVRYAFERSLLVREVRDAHQDRANQQEILDLERMAAQSATRVTASAYGSSSVREALGARYDGLKDRYGSVLNDLLEARAYKSDYDPTPDLRSLADVLGFVRAAPRDVVELHRSVLVQLTSAAPHGVVTALVDEARLALVELMGHLASYYRARSITPGSASPPQDEA